MRLRASNVSIERGGRRLFSNLSFEVEQGEALLVVGPNGVGKSSLLRAIAGLLPIVGGTILLEGGGADASLGEKAHYLGHADALKGALTATENLEFWAAMLAPHPSSSAGAGERGLKGPMKPAEALARLGLPHILDLPVHALSAGQKRRVALARLLVAERPLWLLDEPLNALDEGAQKLFVGVLRERLAEGGLVFAATHTAIDLAGARHLQLREGEVSS